MWIRSMDFTNINVLILILYNNEITCIIIGYLYIYVNYKYVTTGGNWVKGTVLFLQCLGSLESFQNKELKKLAQFSLRTPLWTDSAAPPPPSTPPLPPFFSLLPPCLVYLFHKHHVFTLIHGNVELEDTGNRWQKDRFKLVFTSFGREYAGG